MTKFQPSIVSIAAQDAQWEQRAHEYVVFGSKLTPEERAWQVNVLLSAVIATLRGAADAATADTGKDAAGQLVR